MSLRHPLVRAGALTAIVDFAWAWVLSWFYGSTVVRVFQGVASTLLGPTAMNGGTRTFLIGTLMHVGVAFAWSSVFFFIVMRLPFVRRVLLSRYGAIKVAAVYGPLIWVAMSCAVVPFLTHRPPNITYRWWIQLAGHFPFVGIPIVATLRRAR
jgi:hypothetical protein